MSFSELNLNEKTLAALKKLQFTSATEVQIKAVPLFKEGKDLLIRSHTGTGKTAAFGIGIVERLAAQKAKRALVLTPTRELAIQVCTEIRAISIFHGFMVNVVYGGHSIERQMSFLQGPNQILVATPGRLLDIYRRGGLDLHDFDLVVLDEADLMLDMGFIDDVRMILDKLPKHRQIVLISATLDDNIRSIAESYAHNWETLEIGSLEVVSTVTEEHVEVSDREKLSKLVEVLHGHKGVKTLIFRETKFGCRKLGFILQDRGFRADVLSGDLSQSQRNAVLTAFRDGKINILVATNVAARGLHIDNLDLIINYDEAQSGDVHLHRVGRTGRMGNEGKAITFVRKAESRNERMSDDHPDFAWMRGGSSNQSSYHRRDSRSSSSSGGYSRDRDSRRPGYGNRQPSDRSRESSDRSHSNREGRSDERHSYNGPGYGSSNRRRPHRRY
ncbi:DEAD/DEAH box helicase [Candidatus Micrarchaeota archaeon]|nr:DEAD/DEAH box helicase [Candidatus Micrarchaeota archaeon]